MAELKIKVTDNLEEIQPSEVNWVIVWQGNNFKLFHHVDDDVVYYRNVDEFILLIKEEDQNIIDKCQQYVDMYNEAAEEVKNIEEEFFEYSYPDEYPEEDVNDVWEDFEEKWEKIKEED
jgi:glutathionylspermidine synthase